MLPFFCQVETEQVYEQLQHFVTQTLKARSLQMMGSEDSQEKQEFEQLMARCVAVTCCL